MKSVSLSDCLVVSPYFSPLIITFWLYESYINDILNSFMLFVADINRKKTSGEFKTQCQGLCVTNIVVIW